MQKFTTAKKMMQKLYICTTNETGDELKTCIPITFDDWQQFHDLEREKKNTWSVKYVSRHHYNSFADETTIFVSEHTIATQPDLLLVGRSYFMTFHFSGTVQLHKSLDMIWSFESSTFG